MIPEHIQADFKHGKWIDPSRPIVGSNDDNKPTPDYGWPIALFTAVILWAVFWTAIFVWLAIHS